VRGKGFTGTARSRVMSTLGGKMRFGRVLKLSAAVATAGLAVTCLQIGTAQAQSEVMSLNKFNAGSIGNVPIGPIGIAAGLNGNLWVTADVAGAPVIEEITPDGEIAIFDKPVSLFSNGGLISNIVGGPDGFQWFADTGARSIGKITTFGIVTEFAVGVTPNALIVGADNNIWFTETTGTQIGTVKEDGAVTIFSSGISAQAGIQQIAAGPDGNLWYTEAGVDRIASMTPGGRIFEYGSGISPKAGLFSIVAGPDGNLWFTESATGKIGRITPSGAVTEFGTGLNPASGPFQIINGPDGNLWFAEMNTNRIGRITTSGVVTEFLADTPNLFQPGTVTGISAGPQFNPSADVRNTIWYTQTGTNTISRLSVQQSSALVSSVLPGGRTVAPGSLATVFATMVNGNNFDLGDCQVLLPIDAPAGLQLSYQTTDPSTNALTGTMNTPFTLAANGGSQSLLLTFQSASPVDSPSQALNFVCGTLSAAVVGGLNTVDVNFDADSVPDDIVLGASATPGIVAMPVHGGNAFSAAMDNVGGSDINGLTLVGADTGLAILPLSTILCQTDSSTGACLETPQEHIFAGLPAGSQATFSVFVGASSRVSFDPANNRVYIRFIDLDPVTGGLESRGSASMAVQTTD
jgi:hypothetical protein